MTFVPAEGSTFFHSLQLFLWFRAFSDVWIAVAWSLWRKSWWTWLYYCWCSARSQMGPADVATKSASTGTSVSSSNFACVPLFIIQHLAIGKRVSWTLNSSIMFLVLVPKTFFSQKMHLIPLMFSNKYFPS